MNFFAFFDKKSGRYINPQHFPHSADAMRAAERAVNSGGEHYLATHPSDYDLYFVGSFDPIIGVFSVPESGNPEMVVSIISLKKVSQ